MFSEIPRQSEHFNISQYLININICKFTDNLIEQCTLIHSNLYYPGTVVRRVPITGNLHGSQNYNGYYMCNPKVSIPYFLDSLKN